LLVDGRIRILLYISGGPKTKTYGSAGTLMNPVYEIFTWKTSALKSMVLLTPKLLPTGARGKKKAKLAEA
jgi:hypothetical protein